VSGERETVRLKKKRGEKEGGAKIISAWSK
jgi:hypothetical protein